MSVFPTAPAGQWTYESRPIGAQLYAAFFPSCCVGIAAAVGEYAFSTGGDSPIFGVPALVLIAAILIRARRIGIWADADKVVVQNFWRTYQLAWTDVATIEAWAWGPRRPPQCVFRTREGRALVGLGVSASLDGASATANDLAHVSGTPVKIVGGRSG